MLLNAVYACAAVGSAVVGGVYANFSARVMPRLSVWPEAEAIETMQQFNRNAEQAPFMTFFFGTAAASAWTVLSAWHQEEPSVGAQVCAIGGGLYLAGWVLTIIYNVPRNNRLAGVVAGTAEATRVWQAYLNEWSRANSLRAVLTLLSAATLGTGSVLGIFSTTL